MPQKSGIFGAATKWHGDFHRFSTRNFPQQRQMGREDYVIVTGDHGGVWDGSDRDRYWLGWLKKKPFTTLFVDGNHENFAGSSVIIIGTV